MEIKNEKKENEYPKREKIRAKQQYRVVLNKDANDALENFTTRINDGFEYGKISKSDVANWVFNNIEKKISSSEINAIKEANFDESKALERLLRNSKSGSQKLPPEIGFALKSHLGLPKVKKRAV